MSGSYADRYVTKKYVGTVQSHKKARQGENTREKQNRKLNALTPPLSSTPSGRKSCNMVEVDKRDDVQGG